MEYTSDILSGAFDVAGGSAVLTDGTYYWRRDAAEYVEHYGIGLSDDFLRHGRDREWSAPEVARDEILRIDRFLIAHGHRLGSSSPAYDTLRKQWIVEAAESDLGLWWLADDLRELLGDGAAEQQVRSATLEALTPLLESGQLRAVMLGDRGELEIWSGSVADVLARIESGWKKVGTPNIGDVVWFVGERPPR